MDTPSHPLNPGAEHGMSLMEMLVASLMTTVILAALVALLVTTMNQETRITDRIQADQLGRTAMTNIVEELHSSCTGFGGTPIQAGSGRTNLWFINAYRHKSSTEPYPKSVTEHEIVWEKKGTSNTGEEFGTLTDYAYESTAGEPNKWTFSAHGTSTVLANDVIPPRVSAKPTVFQYYDYSAAQLTELASGELPLTTATAEDVAKVTITFSQASKPTKTATESEPVPDTRPGRTAVFSDSVVLRYTPTESATEESKPCE
ncbi:MAG TPA: hypothetical protein VMB51_10955 [Solirubrobacteraceae bacterium]|nr:hypothetical protein [Solirubrobacteraceae bacterium]